MKEGLVTGEVETINTEINFWQQKLAADTGSYVYMLEMASNYFRLFRTNGNIDALQKGDSFLKQSSAKLNHTDPDMFILLNKNRAYKKCKEMRIPFNKYGEFIYNELNNVLEIVNVKKTTTNSVNKSKLGSINTNSKVSINRSKNNNNTTTNNFNIKNNNFVDNFSINSQSNTLNRETESKKEGLFSFFVNRFI